MHKTNLLVTLFAAISLCAMEDGSIIKIDAIQKSHNLGQISLYKTPEGFRVVKQNQVSLVNPALIDPLLNKLTLQQLLGFQKHGCIYIGQCNDGSYTLRAKVRGNGGGPLTGQFLYWLTKSAAYGGIVAASGTAIVATGGAAAAALGGGSAATAATAMGAATVAHAASASAMGTAMATGGASIIGAGIASSATASTGAALATGASVAASGGCVTTIMVGIETAALTMGTLGTLIPWLP